MLYFVQRTGAIGEISRRHSPFAIRVRSRLCRKTRCDDSTHSLGFRPLCIVKICPTRDERLEYMVAVVVEPPSQSLVLVFEAGILVERSLKVGAHPVASVLLVLESAVGPVVPPHPPADLFLERLYLLE